MSLTLPYGLTDDLLFTHGYEFHSWDDESQVTLKTDDGNYEFFEYRPNGYSGWCVVCPDGGALEFCASGPVPR